MKSQSYQIRDPIHGVIFASFGERAVIETPAFQRLRHIKQVGFADFAFPSATHTRYSHSLGAMFMASRIFDRVLPLDRMNSFERNRMRQAVRLAALLHDIGHPPLSHTTETIMPLLSRLDASSPEGVRATHEDFTLKILLDSPLTKIIEDNFSEYQLSPRAIASLLSDRLPCDGFVACDKDFSPVLRQIISSEIDADRMDYLLRDSFFCGVNYGKFDADWLVENLIGVEHEEQVFLGLKARAIFAFEDFLLSRYHMFLSVYLHHTPVIMEKMLQRFFAECPEAFVLPADVVDYLLLSDLDMWQALRKSQNVWAQKIVQNRPYVVLDERVYAAKENAAIKVRHDDILHALKSRGIDAIMSQSQGVISKYAGVNKSPLFVEDGQNRYLPLEEASPLFVRYQSPAELTRIFVDGNDKLEADDIMREVAQLSVHS